MAHSPIPKSVYAFWLFVATALWLASCSGDDAVTPGGGGGGGGGGQGGDFVSLSVNGGPENTYTEASGLPSIDCDPRVDWHSANERINLPG